MVWLGRKHSDPEQLLVAIQASQSTLQCSRRHLHVAHQVTEAHPRIDRQSIFAFLSQLWWANSFYTSLGIKLSIIELFGTNERPQSDPPSEIWGLPRMGLSWTPRGIKLDQAWKTKLKYHNFKAATMVANQIQGDAQSPSASGHQAKD